MMDTPRPPIPLAGDRSLQEYYFGQQPHLRPGKRSARVPGVGKDWHSLVIVHIPVLLGWVACTVRMRPMSCWVINAIVLVDDIRMYTIQFIVVHAVFSLALEKHILHQE
jgi:hypothetical protein